ncbi:MAG: sporulation protein [Methylotenera sp.]|nr:sporulation protein [Methylotenera sp.]
MRVLVLFLILVNLGLLAYFNRELFLPSVPQQQFTEISPEKITVLNQQQIEAMPKKVATPPPPLDIAKACMEWGVFSDNNLATAQGELIKLSLQATVKSETSQDAKRFWIYKPPLKSPQEALAKAAELKALGIEDIFVVQEPKWKNAISFGVFEDEQLATKLLNELKTKGVKDAVKALRNQGKVHSSLLLTGLTDTEIATLRKLKPEFPAANLKEVSCPN